jgi:hypothetical protein
LQTFAGLMRQIPFLGGGRSIRDMRALFSAEVVQIKFQYNVYIRPGSFTHLLIKKIGLKRFQNILARQRLTNA